MNTTAKPKRKSPRPHERKFYSIYAGRKRDIIGQLAFIRKKHGEGLCDYHIATAWNKKHPNDPMKHERVTRIRNRLGLPRNRRDFSVLNRNRIKHRHDYARSHGWPADMPPRCVQVLDALYQYGPMTKAQIAEKAGLWLTSIGNLPTEKVDKGSIIGHLMHHGFIQVLHQTGTDGKRRRLKVYALRSSVTRNFDGN